MHQILITGGAGFIGAHVSNELLAHGYRVRVLDDLVPQVHGPGRQRPAYLSAEVELIVGDIRDSGALSEALKNVDAVIHLVSLVGVGQSMYQIDEYTSVNSLGTANLLQQLSVKPVECVVVSSSMSIYGEGLYRDIDGNICTPQDRTLQQLKTGDWEVRDQLGRPLTPIPTPESKTPALASVYALSKYDQECLCLMIGRAYGMRAVALRFFNSYGPYQALSNPYTGVLSNFASRVLHGKSPLIYEDGLQRRDFISVYDVARACRLALETPAAAGRAINISSGAAMTVKEVAERTIHAIGANDIKPEITGRYRAGDIRHCYADISLAREVLGWEPEITLDRGLEDLASWLEGQTAEDRAMEARAELAVARVNGMKRPNKTAGPATARKIGLVEWFRPGEYERVESVLEVARALGIAELRTGICWADWYTSEGDGWYGWLIPRLAQDVHILPCFLYTPAALGIVPKFSSPPQVPKSYADFIDVMITRFGEYFDWIELWNRPNSLDQWDSRLDPDWRIFSEMIGGAAYWIRHLGKKSVLPGLWPTDLDWLDLMHARGVLSYVDAVGMQGFPSTSEIPWQGWNKEIQDVRERLRQIGTNAEVWITQAGFSTWRGEERAQVVALSDAINTPVDRIYWQSAHDRSPDSNSLDSSHSDEREYHYGLKRADGSPKLLFQLWSEGGLSAVHEAAHPTPRLKASGRKQHVLITGGAGFIGTNLADRLLSSGRSVLVYDDLSRAGVEGNLEWLRKKHGDNLRVEIADVRDCELAAEPQSVRPSKFFISPLRLR